MNSPSGTILSIAILVTTHVLVQSAAIGDWNKTLIAVTNKWKFSFGNYGKVAIELQKRGYDMGKLKDYAVQAVKAGEAKFDENMQYFSPAITTDVKKVLLDAIPTFPKDDWNERLVDDAREAIEKYEHDPQQIFTVLGSAFLSFLDFRNTMKKLMNENEVAEKGKLGQFYRMGDCVEHVYQGIIRSFYGPCKEESNKFWKKCQPICEKFFEHQA